MSHGTCITVKVDDGDGGFFVLNQSDFNPERHKLYGERAAADGPKRGTVDWLKAELDRAGIEFADDATKAELKALLDAVQSAD